MAPDFSRLRAATIPILTKTAYISSPFIATFLLVHLSAPISAAFGGSEAASKTMLLGREYYQASLTEPLLVMIPLTVHALSGTAKRLLSPSGNPPRPLTRLLTLTGYASMLFLLPVHFFIHRAAPQIDNAPIYAVGPAELDYEFVKTGLQTWPVRSWLLYGGLVLSTTMHMVDGAAILWQGWLKGALHLQSWKFPSTPSRMTVAVGSIVLPTLLGLHTLSKEPLFTFASLAARYRAVFLSSPIYRF